MIITDCSAMFIKADDGTTYLFRTCDYEKDLIKEGISFISHSRGETLYLPDSKTALHSCHGFGGISYPKKRTWLLDGLNDAGLCVAMLALDEGTSAGVPEHGTDGIVGAEFTAYLLATCSDVNEAADTAKNVILLDIPDKTGHINASMHFMVCDKNGGCIVLEATDKNNPGRISVYENNGGILTNSPPFNDSISILNSFIDSSDNTALKNSIEKFLTRDVKNKERDSADYSSVSYRSTDRFIRLSVLSACARLNGAFTDKNCLSIGADIIGSVTEPPNGGLLNNNDSHTLYTVIYELAGSAQYSRLYGSLNWNRRIVPRYTFSIQ